MPQIRQYTDKVNLETDDRGLTAIGRSAQAVGSEAQSAETAGRATGAATAQIGSDIGGAVATVGTLYDQYKTQQDVSRAGPTLAFMQNQFASQWTDYLKSNDPGDPTTRQRFIDTVVQPSLDKWTDGFSTKEGQSWAAGQVKDTLDHQYQKTAADQATIAGAQAIQNQLDFSNLQNNNVTNDPTAYASASKSLDDYHDQSVVAGRTLSAPDQAAMDTHLAEEHKKLAYSQVLGQIQNNPTAGMAALEAGKFDHEWFDVSETPSLLRYGRTLEAAQTEGQKAAAQAQKVQQTADANEFIKTQLTRVSYNPDGTANIPPDFLTSVVQAATKLPGMTPEMMKTTTDWAQEQIRRANSPDKVTTDPSTYAGAITAINSGDHTPGELTTAILAYNTAGHLSDADTKELLNKANSTTANRASLRDQTAFVTSLKKGIDHTILGQNNDPQGAFNAYQFQKYAETVFDTDGDTPQTRQKIVAAVPQFALTGRQAVNNLVARSNLDAPAVAPQFVAPHAAAVPRIAGESAAAYLKRTGG